jgi:hypothetical protein
MAHSCTVLYYNSIHLVYVPKSRLHILVALLYTEWWDIHIFDSLYIWLMLSFQNMVVYGITFIQSKYVIAA